MTTSKNAKVEIFLDPANHKWFICYDGLMDVDAGYFNTKEQAQQQAKGKERGVCYGD